MLKLKNIVKNENTVTCDFYPEDSKTPGSLTYDIHNRTITYTLPKGYEWCRNHVAHAQFALREVAESDEDYKDSMICCWY